MSPPSSQHLGAKRVYGLDILRAFAIFTVVYSHGYVLVSPYVNEHLYHALEFDGVGIFFVLSGYLIGKILLKLVATDVSMRGLVGFWSRRWLRTIPNYLLVLTVLLFISDVPRPDNWPAYYIFAQNLFTPHPGFFSEAWSLSIEEWFYLTFPLCLVVLVKLSGASPTRTFLACALLFVIVPTVLRVTKAVSIGYVNDAVWDAELRKIVLYRLDSIAFGILAAYAAQVWPAICERYRNVCFALGALLLLYDKLQWFYIDDIFYRQYLTFSVSAIGAALLFPKLSTIVTGEGVVYRSITFISLISYSMYLLHLSLIQMTVLPWFTAAMSGLGGGIHAAAAYAVYWLLTISASYALYRLFEQPILKLRDKVSYFQKAPGSAQAAH